jgi:class 3 adenylate cyclase
MPSGTAQRRLAAVLFLDVVGSTTIASDLGDRRWRELLGRFRRTVRAEIRRFGGREEDTAGDGFFVTFPEPARGLRAAVAIARAVQQHGVEVRCGLHFGECEAADGTLAGIAVHIGARVMSLAGPGEVLVTSTVRDLVVGSGIEFEDLTAHELKGVPGTWQIFAARRVDGEPLAPPLPAAEAADRIAAVQAPGMLRKRWPALAGAAVMLAAIAAVVLATRGGGPTSTAPSDSPTAPVELREALVRLDPVTGEVTRTVEDVVHGGLGGSGFRVIAYGDRTVWATGYGTSVIQIDPESGEKTPLRETRGDLTGDLAAGPPGVWVVRSVYRDGRVPAGVTRLDPVRHVFDPPIILPGEFGQVRGHIGVGDRYLWVLYGPTLARVDPASEDVRLVELPGRADTIEAFGSTVLALDQLTGVLYWIDPETATVGEELTLPAAADAIAAGPAGVWMVDTGGGFAQQVAEDGRLGDPVEVGEEPLAVVVGDDVVWVANRGDGTISRIDPTLDRVEDVVEVPGSPVALALEPQSGALWVYLA